MNSATNTESFIALLSEYSIIKVSGSDHVSFLHGQFTVDIISLKLNSTCMSAWCNPKGQVICTMILIKTDDSILLLLRSDQKDYVLKRLSMFVLRADVSIMDLTDSVTIYGANTSVDNLPNTEQFYQLLEKQFYLYLLDVNNEYDDIHPDGLVKWNTNMILAGIPWISEVNKEKFLPQMISLDHLNGLSYQKGCYPGQEVIARLHYRGELKRCLHIIQCESELIEGSSLKTVEDGKAGAIINAEQNNEHYIALAVIDLNKIEYDLTTESGKPIKIINKS